MTEHVDYGDDEVNMEDSIVYTLLHHHRLENRRVKWMIRDEEDSFQLRDEEDSLQLKYDGGKNEIGGIQRMPLPNVGCTPLTLRAFHSFFPDFPVVLDAHWLNRPLAAAKLVAKLDRTRLIREFDELQENGRLSLLNCPGAYCLGQDDDRPVAVVFCWKGLNFGDSFVIHNDLPPSFGVPGAHYVWTRDNGTRDGRLLVLETLEEFRIP